MLLRMALFARSHIVATGNGKYLQSLEEYLKAKGGTTGLEDTEPGPPGIARQK